RGDGEKEESRSLREREARRARLAWNPAGERTDQDPEPERQEEGEGGHLAGHRQPEREAGRRDLDRPGAALSEPHGSEERGSRERGQVRVDVPEVRELDAGRGAREARG